MWHHGSGVLRCDVQERDESEQAVVLIRVVQLERAIAVGVQWRFVASLIVRVIEVVVGHVVDILEGEVGGIRPVGCYFFTSNITAVTNHFNRVCTQVNFHRSFVPASAKVPWWRGLYF